MVLDQESDKALLLHGLAWRSVVHLSQEDELIFAWPDHQGEGRSLAWRISVRTGPSTTCMRTGAVLAKTPLGRNM